MIKSLLIIVLIGGSAFVYTDIDSPSAIYSGVVPLMVLLALVALAVWFVLFIYRLSTTQTATSDGGAAGGFGDFDRGGGGDAGC
jgi:hypothetical protein